MHGPITDLSRFCQDRRRDPATVHLGQTARGRAATVGQGGRACSRRQSEHLWTFARDAGADVAIVSGGKGLRGPQVSG